MAAIVRFRGPGELGQAADACAALLELEGIEAPGEITRPVLDLPRLRQLLLAEREPGAPGAPPSPTVLGRLLPAGPGASAFERQIPIYLLPGQASAQAGFLVSQQTQPALQGYLRRVFAFGEAEGGA